MEIKSFKKLFVELSENIQLKKSGKSWIFQSSTKDECRVRVSLQDSKWSNRFYVNIEIFIRDAFGFKDFETNEKAHLSGHLFRREPKEYEEVFDLESKISDSGRELGLRDFFTKFLKPFLQSVVNISGILEQEKQNELHVLPAVRDQILKILRPEKVSGTNGT